MSEFRYERRKNPSRRRRTAFDVAYQVVWNPRTQTFDVYREGEITSSGAPDRAGAVLLAIHAAEQEDAGLKVSVSSILNDKLIVEWSR